MNIQEPLQLLGGLSPKTFMQRHWQKKPLVIRQAIPGFAPLLDRAELLDLAAQEDVESRLVVQASVKGGAGWRFKHGPFARKALPPFKQAGWTMLVQGVDLHDERLHALMNQFRFVPDARLDDLMISYATDGGGVGPHFDSYDVFLLQAHGRRRWRIGRQKDLSLQPDMPLKILANFEPEEEFVLEPGDMLYLPPKYAHDGIAEGECMTYSIGFRSPDRAELAQEILQRLAEQAVDELGPGLYRDPKQEAVERSAAMPAALLEFAHVALQDALRDPKAVARAVGEYLSEPKANVWFDGGEPEVQGAVRLDRKTRMLYDADHVFINGESFNAGGKDAQLMRTLADTRCLGAADVKRLSAGARALMDDWCAVGWLYPDD
ncbi:MAG: cupin [Curvibacter sp. RIFCSPHIGHO2_12_FULL_63_18]|uniref:cupin domain-containing protein n=1 Tax=Rhodoferax sp. TaxID=50421 RepID=UPI0008D3A057|nr:cupin domain-containing protein [Rhodoferax sp.]OGP01462.1 MAG: cupin [Curvibacter sp. GWA2_63_95]OGP07000.1 MAG: cupin [Curvibacter sp. RIFCSPHIGHO2_12_FULL_63_18]HCX82996.1 cupin [Rhodoferax sp.]